mgnify:CR=1 FL=1
MRLTRYTDYGLRVLMYLGVQGDKLATITEVAEAYDISRNHLVKVVNELGRLGYLRTVRGKGGGIRLGKEPEQIRVGAVVRAMEEHLDIIDCTGSDCPILSPCRLRTALGEARDAFMAVLDRYTLADLLADQQGLREVLFEEAAVC